MNGSMIISLDFELLWGRLDSQTIETYGENVLGARHVVVRMLEMFSKYNVHATWAAVGYLFFDDINELMANLPDKQPAYKNTKYSPSLHFDRIKDEPTEYYFAKEIIECIENTKGQELATHTFSHYYCLEEGQSREEFSADIEKAVELGKSRPESIVFPRNQMNEAYLDILKDNGIRAYRGNEKNWCYHASDKKSDRNPLKRGMRLMDSYLPICGPICYSYKSLREDGIYNMAASRFFRPYSLKLSFVEWLKVRRIKGQMTYAAKHGEVFHLWWHPHNFGKNIEMNLAELEKICQHYQYLNSKYEFQSRNMKEVREYCDENCNVG